MYSFSTHPLRILFTCSLCCLVLSSCASRSPVLSSGADVSTLFKAGMALTAPFLGIEGVTNVEAREYFRQQGFHLEDGSRYLLSPDGKELGGAMGQATRILEDVIRVENQGDLPGPLEWEYLVGTVTREGRPFPVSVEEAPVEVSGETSSAGRWVAANRIGGSGHFYQGMTLLFPEGTLSTKEMVSLLSWVSNVSVHLPLHETTDRLMAVDAVIRAPYGWRWRVSCYYLPVAKNQYRTVIVFTSRAGSEGAEPQ